MSFEPCALVCGATILGGCGLGVAPARAKARELSTCKLTLAVAGCSDSLAAHIYVPQVAQSLIQKSDQRDLFFTILREKERSFELVFFIIPNLLPPLDLR